ncbi:MAG: ketopantoate reductase family protein [Deltaproteobacteria bacterium]
MRIAIYGAGSLGTILGTYLTKAGLPVELINRNLEHTTALKENGARVVGTVDMTVPVKALFPDEMQGTYDVIFLMTKQLNNPEVVAFLKPFLGEKGVICTMQNGIPEPSVAEVVGKERVLGCPVAWGATLIGSGVSELTTEPGALSFGLGSLNDVIDDRVLMVKEILEHMCPVEIEQNLIGIRWSKLLVNATMSGMGTVIAGTFGEVCQNKKARRAAIMVCNECIDVGRAAGVTFARMGGVDIARALYFGNRLKMAVTYNLLPLFVRKHRSLKPSMLQDIEKGKPCEIDMINGEVCAWGRRAGVPTPFNDKVVEIIKKVEAGELECSADNIRLFDGLI